MPTNCQNPQSKFLTHKKRGEGRWWDGNIRDQSNTKIENSLLRREGEEQGEIEE